MGHMGWWEWLGWDQINPLLGAASDPCVATWHIGSITIIEPSIIPTSLLAAFVGIYGFVNIKKQSHTVGHYAYAASFLMFGMMMSDAMLVHCFFDFKSIAGLITGLLDVGLTSSVAMSFFYNGLIDLGLLRETAPFTIYAMVATYTALFGAWLYAFLYNWKSGFLYLYLYTVLIGCGSYGVMELVSLVKNKQYKGLAWLLAGGSAGVVGVLCMTKWAAWLCHSWSPLLSGDFWWFLLSDVAMWCLYKFWVANKVVTTPTMSPYKMLHVQGDDSGEETDDSEPMTFTDTSDLEGVEMDDMEISRI